MNAALPEPTFALDREEPLRLAIASPCSVKWSDMSGDQRVRMCGLCQKRVYNLVNLRRAEVDDLLRANEGRVCIRMYQRPDGTVLTADCPVGRAQWRARVEHRVQRTAVRLIGALAGLVGVGWLGGELFGNQLRHMFGASTGALANSAIANTEAKRAGQSPTRKNITNFASQATSDAD